MNKKKERESEQKDVKVETQGEEEESKGPGRGHPPPPSPHSLTHSDYPPPGAERSVMSIEEVLNLGLMHFSRLLLQKIQKFFNMGVSM